MKHTSLGGVGACLYQSTASIIGCHLLSDAIKSSDHGPSVGSTNSIKYACSTQTTQNFYHAFVSICIYVYGIEFLRMRYCARHLPHELG